MGKDEKGERREGRGERREEIGELASPLAGG